MNPVKGQSSEDRFPKIKGVFQDHSFFQFYNYVLTPNIRPNIGLDNHSAFRGSDSPIIRKNKESS